LSTTESVAALAPVALGVKVTLMVQALPAASVAELPGQVLVWTKSPLLVPVIVMLLIVSGPVPLLVRVTLRLVLTVLTI
jgi:hypothetical protein